MLLGKRHRETPEDPGEYEAPANLVASSWTRGQWLRATAAKIALWGMIACAPAALVMAGLAQVSAAHPSEVAQVSDLEQPGKHIASAIAMDAVVTWLSADRSSQAAVKAAGLPAAQLPDTGLDVSDPLVVDAVWAQDTWLITVSVTVTSIQTEEDDTKPSSTTQRRYFQVPTQVGEGGEVTLLALPAEVASPDITSGQTKTYAKSIPASDPIFLAVTEFGNALLAGSGDIARYTAPGSDIRAVSPAPYTSVAIEAVSAEAVPATHDGAEVDLSVRLIAVNESTGVQTGLDYFLALKLRSGRWEIVAIQPAPRTSPTTTPQPTP